MSLLDYSIDELKTVLISEGFEKFRARQVYDWLCSGVSINEMSNIPLNLKEFLSEKGEGYITSVKMLESSDGTCKFISTLHDGNIIESVLMKKRYGNAVCLSTQVGCRMGCAFCASCKNGLARNLTAGEILSQYIALNCHIGKGRNITNIVLMGMGEPFDNYDETVKFLKLITCPDTFNFSIRNISLSTCGLADKIIKFSDEKLPLTLCISLHAAIESKRNSIMPVSKKWNLNSIISACREYFNKTGRRIIFEYALIKDFNDGEEDLDAIKYLLHNINCHVNLIPLNSVKESDLKSTSKKEVYSFASRLQKKGISCTVRLSLGQDILGACGQLRGSIINKK